MTTDRVLSIIAIIIGVPAFLSLFTTSTLRVEGALALLLISLVVAYRVHKTYRDNLPTITIVELQKKYVILDSRGTHAKFERVQRMKANFKGVTEFWCRNIAQDGSVSNFLFDGQPPELEQGPGGTTQIRKRFPLPLEVGKEVTVVMTCDYHDSFTREKESIIHINTLPTKLVSISITLPRPCIKAEAYKTYGGQEPSLLENPNLTNGNKQIEMKIKKPLMGASYHLDWTW